MAHPIFAFGDRITAEYAELHPVEATFFGVEGYDDRVDDYSPDGVEESAGRYRSWLKAVGEMPNPEDYWDSLATRVIAENLSLELVLHDAGRPYADLNNIASPPQDLAMMFEVMDKESEVGWDLIAGRLHALEEALAGYRASLEVGRSQGNTASRRQVEAVVEQAGEHTSGRSGLAALLEAYRTAGAPGGERLERRIATGIESARRAFDTLAGYLTSTYHASAADADPVGPERYLPAATYFLGTEIEAEEVYAWGWSEVARLRAAMEAAAEEIRPGASIPEVIELLKADPERASRDRQHFVDVMTELQLKALGDLDGTAFRIPQQARQLTVNISPPGSTLGARYIGPSEDFTRPGSVWYSLDDSEHQIPTFSQISTNYHEGFPGHHLQVVYQMTNAGRLTRFHRTFVWYSGSGEGWALYAERLMHELGYFDRPEYVLNTHAEAMLRACRVVIDIGSHMEFPIPDEQPFHPGERWSFDTAVEMLIDYALQPPPYARSEVTRYLGWPGQAIAYKVGEREILKMRDELMARDGEGFDLMDFHDRVLTPGAIGLDHLRDLVVG